MCSLYPLRFQPLFRQYLWGGRRLESLLGKNIPPGDHVAESWEVVDRADDQSIVLAGPLAGCSLAELMERHGESLLGRHHPLSRFPLLFKFLDAQQTLSVQVHPSDSEAAQLDPPDLGKSEAWVVLAAEPESKLYVGLKRGFDREALEREIHHGTGHLCLHTFQPQVGDCIFLPAGMVHAIGEGLLIAEIQQASDTTYRLFDWNRVDAEGKARELHIEQGLEVIDYALGPGHPQTLVSTSKQHVHRLVDCEKFVLDRWTFGSPEQAGGDDRCHILAVIQGSVVVDGDAAGKPAILGDVLLLPANCGAVLMTPHEETVLLDMYLP